MPRQILQNHACKRRSGSRTHCHHHGIQAHGGSEFSWRKDDAHQRGVNAHHASRAHALHHTACYEHGKTRSQAAKHRPQAEEYAPRHKHAPIAPNIAQERKGEHEHRYEHEIAVHHPSDGRVAHAESECQCRQCHIHYGGIEHIEHYHAHHSRGCKILSHRCI